MANPSQQSASPRGEHRILYVSDPSTIARFLLPDPVHAQDLRAWVDMVADAGVDQFAQEVFSQGWTAYWRSNHCQYDQRLQHRRFLPLLDAGVQPLEVLIDQAHKRGMKFIAGFRMNDGHAYQAKSQGLGIAEFIESHPDLQLKQRPEGKVPKQSVPLDFSFEQVRSFTLGVIREVAARFDIDGVELCFRDDAYFPPGHGAERGHLMTELVRHARAALNDRASAAGKPISLGARVPPTIEESVELGLQVPRWIDERLLDYVSPMDRMYADFNVPYDTWAGLTRNSDCLLYPGLLPWTSHRARYRLKKIPLSHATSRALVHTMYSAGADGVSVYNHQVVGCWHPPFYPQSMQVFHQLRDPARVARGERHYVFDPTWAGFTGYGTEGKSPGGVINAQRVVINRASAPDVGGEFRFNLYEDLHNAHGATLCFRGFGMTERDDLEVRLNGQAIPNEIIRRSWRSNSPPEDGVYERHEGGRTVPCLSEGGRLDAREVPGAPAPEFSSRVFTLTPSMVKFGDNRLALKLLRSDPRATEPIVIDELEIWVEPR